MVIAWVLVIFLGAMAAIQLNDRLTAVTDIPGSASAGAQSQVRSAFGSDTDSTFLVLYEFTQASEAEIADYKQRIVKAAVAVPTAVVQQQRAVGGVLYSNISTSLPLLQASAQTPVLRQALTDAGLGSAMVTGPPALEHDIRPILADDLKRGGLLGLVLAVVVLLVAFGRSRRVFIPMAIAAATVAGSLCIVYLISSVTTMVLYVPNIVELVGLGLAIDYAVLLTHRHQLAADRDDAIPVTMNTAGRTVQWAGATAIVGLATLLLVPIPLVRSLGLAGVIVPMVAVLASSTLMPPLLHWLGSGPPRGLLVHGAMQFWARTSGWATNRPRLTLFAALMFCGVLAVPLAAAQLAPASLTSLPTEAPAAQALAYLSNRLGPGVVTPNELLIELPVGTARSAQNDAARQALAAELTKLPEVYGVFTDVGPNYIDASASYHRIFVIGRHEFADPRSGQLVTTLRGLDPSDFGYDAAASISVAGAPAQGVDFLSTLTRVMPPVMLLILLAAILLLARVFGSWRIAVISAGLNVVSLAAACGVVVALFQFGAGSGVLGTYHVARIESWTFVFMFALLFGLTTDYQVFIVRSMLESVNREEPIAAVRSGIMNSAGVVTAGALAFVVALSGLMFGRIAGLQELGFGLAAGVLIDATIVRGLLLPSALTLLRLR